MDGAPVEEKISEKISECAGMDKVEHQMSCDDLLHVEDEDGMAEIDDKNGIAPLRAGYAFIQIKNKDFKSNRCRCSTGSKSNLRRYKTWPPQRGRKGGQLLPGILRYVQMWAI